MFKFRAQGYYSWVVLNDKDKIVSYAKTPQPNLILKQGLNGIAVRSWADSFVACAVGTGTSSPAITQVGLDNEVRRTATYLDLVDANSTTLSENVYTLRRTFVFPKEGGNVTYTEAGFSYSTTGPNALFSRIKLPSISVSSGQRLIVQYELQITISPDETVPMVNPVSGRNSTGVFAWQRIGLKGVNSLGQTYNYDDAEGCNEPSTITKGFLSVSSTAPAAFGSTVNRAGSSFTKNVTLSSYVEDSYTLEKLFDVGQKEALGTWSSAGLGSSTSPQAATGLVYVFDTPVEKPQGSLILSFRFTWASVTRENYDALFYWQSEENMVLKRQNPLLSYWNLSDD